MKGDATEMTGDRPHVKTVLKVGGSLLRDAHDYEGIAERLRPWLDENAWVVVSAACGVTDRLQVLARERRVDGVPELFADHARFGGAPLPSALRGELANAVRDPTVPATAIVSWGERASAAALGARLVRLGVRVPIAELPLRGLPPAHRAALVPGFYLRDPSGRVCLLPRGGSDISAVLLASRLGVPEVRLWKDGGGIRAGTSVANEIDGRDLLDRLGAGIRPLHPAAVRLALRRGIALTMEDPHGRHPPTRISVRLWTAMEVADAGPGSQRDALEFPRGSRPVAR